MADYPDAIDYYVDSSRVFNFTTASAIVLHGTASVPYQTVQQLGDFFRSDPTMASVHFGIDRNGVIAQYVPLQNGAAGNCCLEAGHDPFWDQFNGDNLNIHTISIEHVNDVNNSLSLTTSQQNSAFKLIKWLCNKYGLTYSQIKTHASIDPQSRARCPGSAYPLLELERFLGGNMGIPTGCTDNGTTLTFSNGVQVVLGFRDYILNNNWDAANAPIQSEYSANPVLIHATGWGEGSRLLTRDNLLWYTTKGGVINEPYMGSELDAAYKQIADMQISIDKLKAQLAVAIIPPTITVTTNIIPDNIIVDIKQLVKDANL